METSRILSPLGQPTNRRRAAAPLTSREREVLRLIALGESTRSIAERLNRSIKTIMAHRQNLMRKLAIRNVAGLTRYAIRQGLISADD